MSCHQFDETATTPARLLFTDFGYDAAAAPRNLALPANRAPSYFDSGLCQTARAQRWRSTTPWCGYFRTPSLRNVAVRERFMHNGVFSTLHEVVEFYATRATDPAKWYKTGVIFDDLPARLRANINVNSVPYNRRPGSTPALTPSEMDDIVAFLGTLTDAQFSIHQSPPDRSADNPLRSTRSRGR